MLILKILRANRASVGFIAFFLGLQLLVVVGVGAAGFHYKEIVIGFTLVQWMSFYLGASVLMSLSLMATTFLSFMSGYFLGFNSIPFVVTSYLLASAVSYFISRRIDNGTFLDSVSGEKEVAEMLENLKESHLSMIIFARLSPVLPFSVMNILLCMTGVSFRHFMIGGLIGMLPRALFTIWVGWQASKINLFSPDHSAQTYAQVGLIAISIGGMYYLFNRALRKKTKRRTGKELES